ncbi:ribosome hibernation-promoting factor, HPF/YfiA family [Cetobacterium sp. SF1]|uniref:ribosome hibernation-promoting factor, HPF/YfiA family n=1 Tax=unclassified Cetobacterium TaxID=2630983 RepID=UPI003CE6CAEF
MNITFNGAKGFVITEAIKAYAEKRLNKLAKYGEDIKEIRVTLSAVKSKTGPIQTAEVRVHLNGYNVIKAVAVEDDLYASIDKAEAILDRQMVKYKEKHKEDKYNSAAKVEQKIEYNAEERLIKMESTKQIVNVSVSPKPMAVEEAILQMETLNKDFYVFINAESGEMNVVYKKRNGDYGHVEPENK